MSDHQHHHPRPLSQQLVAFLSLSHHKKLGLRIGLRQVLRKILAMSVQFKRCKLPVAESWLWAATANGPACLSKQHK